MAIISGAARDNLPDSDFAYIESGGSKDDTGRTVPRSKRHFPIQDAEHVRNALARIGQGAQFGQEALPKVKAAAKKFGVDAGKALGTGYEHKTFSFKIEGEPDDEGRFTGYAAVFGNVDRGKDLIEPGAVTKTLQDNPEVPLFWRHDYSQVPIGVGTLASDGKGVRIDGRLFIQSSELAREVFGAMKAGAVKGLSIGYNTIHRAFKSGVRHLQEIAIGEVSLTPSALAMNPLAEVDSVKDLRGYESTDGVDALLRAIACVADFMVGEVAEGDTADASRSLGILNSLAKLLTSELGELADGTDGDNGDEPDAVYVPVAAMAGMSATVDWAIKNLLALRTGDIPREAAAVHTEPAMTTLRELAASMRG